jgi:hypothetical protein
MNDPPRFQDDVRQAFQPDSKPDDVRLESLTDLIFWRVVANYALRGSDRRVGSYRFQPCEVYMPIGLEKRIITSWQKRLYNRRGASDERPPIA